jgi:integrase/recombinase XerD
MATLNLVLDQRRSRKDGTYPLVFRIRMAKKFSDIKTDFKVKPEDFDIKTSSILNDIESNEILNQLQGHYLKRLREFTSKNIGSEDVKEARKYLVNKKPNETTIEGFWNDQIEEMKIAGRHGGARIYKMTLSVVSQETDLKIPFSNFTFKDLLELEKRLYQRGASVNGISVYMRTFRAICNKAINMEIVNHEWYPFRKYKLKKGKTTPRVLSMTEIKEYFNLDINEQNPLFQSWLIGKLIFMLRGINLKDLLLLSSTNLKNGRVIYKRSKTGKIYSIKIEQEVFEILNQFQPGVTLLGLIDDKDLKDKEKLVKILLQKCKVINSHLKKLGQSFGSQEEITTYVFRYTFSNVAKQLGYSKDLIAEALGHEYGNSVTGIYLEQFDLELIDDMNRRIIYKIKGG